MLRSRRLSALALSMSVLAVTLACSQSAGPVEPAAMAGPLEGVWSVASITPADGSALIDPAQPGLWIFTKGYYSDVHTTTADPRMPAAVSFQPTDEERVAQHRSMVVNTGTYEISGSMLTCHPTLAKAPGLSGGVVSAEFAVDGDMLMLTMKSVTSTDGHSPANVGDLLKLRRVE